MSQSVNMMEIMEKLVLQMICSSLIIDYGCSSPLSHTCSAAMKHLLLSNVQVLNGDKWKAVYAPNAQLSGAHLNVFCCVQDISGQTACAAPSQQFTVEEPPTLNGAYVNRN